MIAIEKTVKDKMQEEKSIIVTEKIVKDIKELKKEAVKEYVNNPNTTILLRAGKELPMGNCKEACVSLNATLWKGIDAVTMIKADEELTIFEIPKVPENICIFEIA